MIYSIASALQLIITTSEILIPEVQKSGGLKPPPPPFHIESDLKHPFTEILDMPMMVGYAMSPQTTMSVHVTFALRIQSPKS